MHIYKRYFRVTTGELITKINELQDARYMAAAEYDTLCQDVGAKSAHTWDSGSFAGFKFDMPPDKTIFRKAKHTWIPKKNCHAGKDLWARIDPLPKPQSVQKALAVVELYSGIPVLIDGCTGYYSTLCGFGSKGVWFVQIPWRDEDPKKLDQYVADRNSGIRRDCELDHLLWNAPADWQEIKHWQFLKEWEELSEKSKTAA